MSFGTVAYVILSFSLVHTRNPPQNYPRLVKRQLKQKRLAGSNVFMEQISMWARCHLQDEDEETSVLVDLMIDDGLVARGMRYFGELRTFSNECFPLIFTEENGALDLGCYAEDRYERLKLHGQAMHVGATFQHWYEDEEGALLIVKSIETLAEPVSIRKGGRPPMTAEWDKFWIALLGMALSGDLTKEKYPKQDNLVQDLEKRIGLGKESIKRKVAHVWRELNVNER